MAQKYHGDRILIIFGPEARTKKWYLEQFKPDRLITIMPDFWDCISTMEQRPGHKGKLYKEVKEWYARFSRHGQEELYERATDILDNRTREYP
jgi:hypothetical protein